MWWGCVCTQSQTRRSPGCTSYTMELRVGAAQDGRNSSEEHKRHLLYLEAGNNTPTWNSAPRFPSAIVSPPVRRATEERGKGGCGGGGGTETDFLFFFFPAPRPRPASKNPPFVFVPRLRRFSWERFDGQLSVCRSIM